MKRIHILCILFILALLVLMIIPGCDNESKVDDDELQLVGSYELVAANVNSKMQTRGEIVGAFLLGFGDVETKTIKVYNFWYKREDGGVVPATIDLSAYNYAGKVSIVVYEDDSAIPKVEIWKNGYAQIVDASPLESTLKKMFVRDKRITEVRFTIPSGTFVNTYDLQGLTENTR